MYREEKPEQSDSKTNKKSKKKKKLEAKNKKKKGKLKKKKKTKGSSSDSEGDSESRYNFVFDALNFSPLTLVPPVTSLGLSSTSDVLTFDQSWYHLSSISARRKELFNDNQTRVISSVEPEI